MTRMLREGGVILNKFVKPLFVVNPGSIFCAKSYGKATDTWYLQELYSTISLEYNHSNFPSSLLMTLSQKFPPPIKSSSFPSVYETTTCQPGTIK